MADATKELKVVISSDTKQAESNLSSFGKTMSNIGQIAAGIGLERIAEKALEMGKAFVTSSVAAYSESQKLTTQLDTVLKSTNNAVGMTRDQLIGLSKELQNTTAFDDEAALSAENLLLTFTKIGKDVFPQATKTVMDMSTALGQDTKSSAIQLGKALQDPILGITALRRVGVNFTDQQKEQIKVLVESGKSLEAQKLILQELNTEFGGSAVAAATTYEGRMKQLNNTFGEIKESIGKMIVDVVTPLMEKLAPIVTTISQVVDGSKNWQSIFQTIGIQFPQLAVAWDQVMGVIRAIDQAIGPEIAGVWNSIKDLVVAVMEFLKPVVQAALAWIQEAWKKYGADVLLMLKGNFEMLLSAFKLGLDLITGAFKIFKDLFTGNWKQLWTDVKDTFKKIVNDITGILKGFFDWASGLINGLLNSISNIGKSATTPQKRASGGYASGLTLVGERGPELVSLPTGSYVHNNDETSRMMAGATVNIYNPSVRSENDITEIVRQVKAALGRENELASLGAI